MSVEIRDKDGSNILSCIPTTNIFIEAGLDRGGVLVHCFGGKSRSPAFIAAYLMSSSGVSFDEANRVLKSARPAVDINLGFEYQLRAYAAAKYDVYVAQQLLLRARIRELHLLRGDSAMLCGETNVSEHLTVSKLSVANLLGNQQPIQQRLEQVTAKNMAKHRAEFAAQQKLEDRRNKRSFDGDSKVLEVDVMDIDGTDGDESSYRSPYDHKSSRGNSLERMDPEESQDSAVSGMSTDSSRQGKLPKEHYGDVSQDDKRSGSGSGVTFHAGVTEGSSSSRKSKAKANHGSRGSGAGVEAKNPSCRLSRPGSTAIRVIPPLRGLEREFKCSWCNTALFQLANVIRTDLDLMEMLEDFIASLQASSCSSDHRHDLGEPREDLEEAYLSGKQHTVQPLPGVGKLPGIASSSSKPHRPDSQSVSMDMEVEEDDMPFVAPLKTSKAAKGGGGGFSFDMPSPATHTPPLHLPISMSRNSTASSSSSLEHSFPKATTPRTLAPIEHIPSSGSSTAALLANPGQPNSPRLEPILLSSNSLPTSDFKALGTGAIALLPRTASVGESSASSVFPSDKSPPKSFFAPLFPGLNPPNHGRLCFDISPRVVIPPHRQAQAQAQAAPLHYTSNSSTALFDRPASAEKRRWLARVNLLREGDLKVAQLAEQDDEQASLAFNEEKYFYLEYLDWMGKEVFVASKDYSDICCLGCKRVVGCWNWTPSQRLLRNGHTEAPLFLINKHVVHHVGAPLPPPIAH